MFVAGALTGRVQLANNTSAPVHGCAQGDIVSTAGLVAALERCWRAIRRRHAEIPAAVIVVASASPAKPKQGMKWGHFASLRWQHGQRQLPEVLVSGEGLARTPAEVFTTLLHEAAHALADARGIQDTSRQGRWHNQKFANHARELGLGPSKDDKLGWSPCALPEITAQRYKPHLDALDAAICAFRRPEPTGEGRRRTNSNNGITCECEYPRKLRISRTAFDDGPIVCASCASAFLPDDIDRNSYEHPTFTTNHPGNQAPDDVEGDPMVFNLRPGGGLVRLGRRGHLRTCPHRRLADHPSPQAHRRPDRLSHVPARRRAGRSLAAQPRLPVATPPRRFPTGDTNPPHGSVARAAPSWSNARSPADTTARKRPLR